MPLITGPGQFEKGYVALFHLVKSELAAHATVTGDAYFSDTANWKYVDATMFSTTHNQVKILRFPAHQASPTARMLVSPTGKDDFEVRRVTIHDFDGGTLTIPRSDLVAAQFDVSVAPAVSGTKVSETLFSSNVSVDLLGTPVAPVVNTHSCVSSNGRMEWPNIGSTGQLQYDLGILLQSSGAIHFDAEFAYDGTPGGAETRYLVSLYQAAGASPITITHDNTGELNFTDDSGSSVIDAAASFSNSSVLKCAIEWGSNTLKFYVGGVQVGSDATTATYSAVHNMSLGGAYNVDQLSAFKYMDNIRFYSEPQIAPIEGEALPSNQVFLATYETSLNSDHPDTPLVPTDSFGGAGVIYDSGKLVFPAGQTGKFYYDLPAMDIANEGKIAFDFTPDYTDNPTTMTYLVELGRTSNGAQDSVQFRFDGNFGEQEPQVLMTNSGGSAVIQQSIPSGTPFTLTTGVSSNISIEWGSGNLNVYQDTGGGPTLIMGPYAMGAHGRVGNVPMRLSLGSNFYDDSQPQGKIDNIEVFETA